MRGMTTRCYKCEAEITFTDEHISMRTGRKIPLDSFTMEPHLCPMYNPPKKYKPCNSCGALIYFDKDAAKSINGKWVPLEQKTNSPHNCPESDFNKDSNSEIANAERTVYLEKVKEGLAKMRAAKKQEDEDLEEARQALI